jgi:hypothetical protein
MRIITGVPLALIICLCGWLDLDSTLHCAIRLESGSWAFYPGESHEHIRCKLRIFELDSNGDLYTEPSKSLHPVVQKVSTWIDAFCTRLWIDALCIIQSSEHDALREQECQV